MALTDGTVYSVNSSLGTGTVVSAGASTTFSTTLLNGGTSYDFYVYAYNSSSCFGPFYRVSNPLFATAATQSCTLLAAGTYSVGPTGTYTTLGAALTAAANGTSGNVIFELQNTYTSAGESFPLTLASPSIRIEPIRTT